MYLIIKKEFTVDSYGKNLYHFKRNLAHLLSQYWLWLIKMLYNSLENQSDKKHENNNVVCVCGRETQKERDTLRLEGVHNYLSAISLIPAKG